MILGKMRNILINEVCFYDCSDFIKRYRYYKDTNNVLLNLDLGCSPLLNSYKKSLTKQELGKDVLKCFQLESKKRKVEVKSEDNTTEDKGNEKETIDYKVTDNKKDNESVQSIDLLQR